MLINELPTTERVVQWTPKLNQEGLSVRAESTFRHKLESIKPPSQKRPPRLPSFKLEGDLLKLKTPAESRCVKECKLKCKLDA